MLYPGVFPNLAALVKSGKARADLVAILLTGIPAGIVPGFQNFTGPLQADMLRLNTAIPPAANPNNLGLIGGDLAGFPNGRRVFDDVVTIELRAIAGVTFPLVDQTFTPDKAAGQVTDGLDPSQCQRTLPEPVPLPGRAVQRVRQPILIPPPAGQAGAGAGRGSASAGLIRPGPPASGPVNRRAPRGDRSSRKGQSREREQYGPAEAGTVVLEIGADTGALMLCTPADLAGREIEISPASEPARRRHASVRQRRTGGGTGHAAIYDRLAPGSYTIWRDHAAPAATITITGGQVTSYDWPAGHRGQIRETPEGTGDPEHRHTFPPAQCRVGAWIQN